MPKSDAQRSEVDICVQRGQKTMLDLTPLEKAIVRMEEALDLCEARFEPPDPRLKWLLCAGAIQAFGFTYELSFKMIKRHLATSSVNPAEIDAMTFSGVVREAFRQGLVKSEPREWLAFREQRGTTSHTYDEEKAQQVFEAIPCFLTEVRFLRDELKRRNK